MRYRSSSLKADPAQPNSSAMSGNWGGLLSQAFGRVRSRLSYQSTMPNRAKTAIASIQCQGKRHDALCFQSPCFDRLH